MKRIPLMRFPRLVAPIFLALFTAALSAAPTDEKEARMEQVQDVVEHLKYQTGHIDLHNGVAKLALPENFRYLGPDDTEKVLTVLWGNPPMRQKTLGMMLPKDVSPVEDDAWAVIIEGYEEDGYVKDDDAAKIDYNDLLKKMQEASKENNAARIKEGYPAMELVGWATPPRYDAQAKKLYWAKELKVDGAPVNSLNYNIRILGRRGTLVLNAIAGIGQLKQIEEATPTILTAVDFQDGHRYADFNPKTDKVATYGLAALVAGGLLAKGGFFKVLLAGLLAAKKFVVLAVVALFSFIKKLFGKKDEQAG